MEKKKFSIEDIEMIKENDRFGNDQLSGIIGGKLDVAMDSGCECDCIGGNCNDKQKG